MTAQDDIAVGYGRGMLLLAVANAVYIASAYVMTMFVARLLEPTDFAVYGIVTGWVSILTALLVRGLTACISREMAEGTVDRATAWRAGVRLGMRTSGIFTGIGIVAAPFVANLTEIDDHLALVVACSLAACTFGANAVLLAWPMGNHDYGRQQAAAQAAYALARMALVIGGAAGWGVTGAAIGYVLGPAVASVALLGRRPAATADTSPIVRRMAREFLPVGIVSITVTAFFIVDVFAMSAAGAPRAAVGIYVAYTALAHVPFYLLQAASATMVPAIAAAAVADRGRAIRRTMTDTIVLLSGPTLLLVTAGDAAARVIFGAKYHTDGIVVAPLAVGTSGITVIAGLVAVAVALKRLRMPMLLTSIGVAALAAASAVAASSFGDPTSSVAFAMCATCLATAIALGIDARLHYGALIDMRRAASGVAVAAIASLPPLFVEDDAVRMAAATICGIAWLAVVVKLRLVDLRRRPTTTS